MLFTILLIVWSNKVDIAMMWYCSSLLKHFNKELVMTIENDEDFEKSTNWWICYNDFVNGDVKVKDHCHITGKYRGSAHEES